MKNTAKRLFSLMLALCMVLSMLPLQAEAASNSEIRTKMIQILYNGKGGRMSCDFDGYVNTSGRHEGIDFCASGGAGSSIYSLISGVVTRVSNDSSLSTLAIYDETNNMTVVYLHGHYSLSAGDQVTQGQYVGYESNLGASAAHTHIEVRSGKKTSAAVSVGDSTLNNSNPYPYWEKVLFGSVPDDDRTVDSRFSAYLPIHSYPISTGNITVYNASGTAYSNRYITGSTDLCIINQIYTDGWCYVSYPSSAETDGYFDAYVKLTTFIASASTSSWTSTGTYDAFRRSDLSDKLGSVSKGDKCLVVTTSGNKKQVVYPVTSSGYYKMGWINVTGTATTTDSDFPTPILGYNHSASAKTTVYETVASLGGTSYGQIFVDDLCTINSVSISGNWVNVTYPVSSGTKTGYVYLDQFFPSLGNISKPYTTKVSSNATAYRKADMATSIGEVYTSDTITVVGKSSNAYQVLYPVTTGTNAGKYKLGWIYADKIAKNLVSIAVTTKPSKTVYLEGESFSTSGMVVTATYDDGSTAAVAGYTYSGYSSTPGSKTITISYGGKTTAIDVTVQSKSPTALTITTQPTKTAYFVGEDFDTTGMVVKATYNNGTSANVTGYKAAYDFGTAGQKTVTVSYQYNGVTVSTTLTVTVSEPTISSIAVATNPTKTSYYAGDTLDTTGLKLTATYNNGTTQTITSGFTCSPTTLNTAGTQTITVSYGGKTATFTVTVSEIALTGLSVASVPSKTSYYAGDTLDTTGLKLTATYNNGTTQTITSGFTCSPTTLSTVGTQTIMVSYGGKSTSFTVTVKALPTGALTVGSVAGNPGDTVQIPLVLNSNPGLIAARLKISYNSDALTLTGVADGGILGEYVFGGDLSANPYIVMWENGDSSADFTNTGTLVTLTFQVKQTASEGTYPVTVSYDPEEVYNYAMANVSLSVTQGSVAVEATQDLASGYSGDLTWKLSGDGVLTFSGSGKMRNYEYKSEMPWYSYRSQIKSVVLESGVTSIGDYAFYGMPAMTAIEIPATVTSIGDYAFKNCSVLNGVVLPEKLTKLGDSAFYACTSLTAIEIPAKLYTIKAYTFKNCTALASVTFHEGNLEKISDGAFYNTALTELTLPDCLNILDVYTFKNCSKLRSIDLGSGLSEIREAAFYGSAIPTITIPEGITKIGPYAFKNCTKLVSVDLPSTLTSVGEASFYACTALESLDLPDAVTKIGNYAFRKCAALLEVSFGSGLVNIGESSFYGCESLVYLDVPENVTTIQGYAFKGCSDLEIVNLSDSLVTLGDSAFHTCTSLSEITIPANVTKIGEYCFSGSSDISSITFKGDAPAIGSGAFNKITASAYYPSGNTTWTASVRQNYGGTITWYAD